MDIGNETTALEAIVIQEISHYYQPILIWLGILGNCLSMCVFFRTKLRYFSSSIYLGALALSDTGYLATHFNDWLKEMHMKNLCWSDFYVFIFFVQNLCYFLSIWFVVAFTIERYVAIKWPLHRKSLCTVARAKIVVIGLIGISILYSILLAFLERFAAYMKNGYEFTADEVDKYSLIANISYIITPIVIVFLPLPTITIVNILMAYEIYKHSRIRKILIESNASNEGSHTSNKETPQTKITTMLIVVSSVFICLNTPKCVCWFISGYYDKYPTWLTVLWGISEILDLTNYGINFILYCLCGQNFRRELICMFTKCLETKKIETVITTLTNGK